MPLLNSYARSVVCNKKKKAGYERKYASSGVFLVFFYRIRLRRSAAASSNQWQRSEAHPAQTYIECKTSRRCLLLRHTVWLLPPHNFHVVGAKHFLSALLLISKILSNLNIFPSFFFLAYFISLGIFVATAAAIDMMACHANEQHVRGCCWCRGCPAREIIMIYGMRGGHR